MKTKIKILLFACALFQFTVLADLSVVASYEYDWTGGKPGYSSKIFLNAPSSAQAADGGRDADVLPGSYMTTPFGTFSIMDYGLNAAFGFGGLMIWDQTHIIAMDLFFQPVSSINNPAYNQPAIGHARANTFNNEDALEVGSLVGGFGPAFFMDDFTGHWLPAPVPEPSVFAVLFLGAGAALSRRQKVRGIRGGAK